MRQILLVCVLGIAVPSLAEGQPANGVATTIWDGVYTESQARRGEEIYPSVCGRCHGYKLDGAPDDPDFFPTPPIAGGKFLRNWNGASLLALFEYTRSTMPEINPGSLSDREFADLLSFMLAASGAPAGPGELEPTADAQREILIVPER